MSETRGPGTIRGLRQLTTTEGRVAAVAVDQRQALRTMLTSAGVSTEDHELRRFKVAVARAVGDLAPALLVDPQYGLPAVAADPLVDPRLPLMVAIEESGTVPWDGGSRSVLLPGWGAHRARAAGACAAKLLVYARPDHAASFNEVVAVVDSVGRDCRQADIPFVLEILPYQLASEDGDAYRSSFGKHVRSVAEVGASFEPDLLKLAWPGVMEPDSPADAGALEALADLGVPWAILSAGADADMFVSRVERALDEGGACGFICGRALWKDAVGAPDVDAALLAGARPRLARLLETMGARGVALPVPDAPDDPAWFRS